jgi:hypothetical protein
MYIQNLELHIASGAFILKQLDYMNIIIIFMYCIP